MSNHLKGSMRTQSALVALAIALFATSALSATEYNLFVHGRSGDNHCVGSGIDPYGSTNQANYDKNFETWLAAGVSYWHPHYDNQITLPNVRYVGWSGKHEGATGWGTCGARRELWHALYLFCRNGNVCNIYTHSTGSLVVSMFITDHDPDIRANGIQINRIQFMASASGGSELANVANAIRTGASFNLVAAIVDYLALSNTAGVDASVATYAARAPWIQKYQSYGRLYYTTAGDGWHGKYSVFTAGLLPGLDDGVLAHHSNCSVNSAREVEAVCGMGNGQFRHRYWSWTKWKYIYYDRWTPYYTIRHNGSDHSQQIKYWSSR